MHALRRNCAHPGLAPGTHSASPNQLHQALDGRGKRTVNEDAPDQAKRRSITARRDAAGPRWVRTLSATPPSSSLSSTVSMYVVTETPVKITLPEQPSLAGVEE